MKLALVFCLSGWALSACQSPAVAGFPECVKKLKARAWEEARIPAETFDRMAHGVSYLPALAEPGPPPPEFANPTWEYTGFLVDDQKIAQGREVMTRWQTELDYIESQTGVAPATAVAFFGVETDFGRFKGQNPVVPTLINRACGPITSSETAKARERKQLYAALQIVELGDVKPDEFKGSYAGAFGFTQFIPGTYLEHRGKAGQLLADGDRDGRVDVMHSIPDALMLTALKVKADGWAPGLPWALAVRLPAGFDPALILRERAFGGELYSRTASTLLRANRRPLADWQKLGVSVVGVAATAAPANSGSPGGSNDSLGALVQQHPALTPQTPFALISLNDDAPGPYILASVNFEAHYRYNFSLNYAYSVGLLADRLGGREALPVQWASADRGLSRVEILELQCRLAATHPEVQADGSPGPKTRAAIGDEETRLARPATGRTTFSLLKALREGEPASACGPQPALPTGPDATPAATPGA